MRIPLVDADVNEITPTSRQVRGAKTSMLLMNLLESENDLEYRNAATLLKLKLLPPDTVSSEQKYDCPHPDWFDIPSDQIQKVDSTTCRFCGYRPHCTLGRIDLRDYVEIISLDSSSPPSKQFLLDECFTAVDNGGNRLTIDPFTGFTPKAGRTRQLYLISQDNFLQYFGDNLNDTFFDAAIGYDSHLNQAIWPIDQLFLELHEKNKKSLHWEIGHEKNFTNQHLTRLDQNCLSEIAHGRRWILPDDPDDYWLALHELFSHFVEILKNRKFNSQFVRLASTPMIPHIDHPFGCSGSGFLHIAIRWIELKPEDLEIYYKEYDGIWQEIIEKLAQRMRVNYEDNISLNSTRYFPRFPMIAFSSEANMERLEIEQPAGRIIDVIETSMSNILLLIDGLGFDLQNMVD